MIIRKTGQQLEKMAAAGAVHARCMKMLTAKVRQGATTAELDEAAEKFIRSQGGVPTFKGFRGFPGSICASANSMVVHGIPGPYELEKGDILSIDIGVTLDGWVADGASTIPVGPIDETTERLLTVTRQSLDNAVAQVVPGNRIWLVGRDRDTADELSRRSGGLRHDLEPVVLACRHRVGRARHHQAHRDAGEAHGREALVGRTRRQRVRWGLRGARIGARPRSLGPRRETRSGGSS